jgi:hypothetical protein
VGYGPAPHQPSYGPPAAVPPPYVQQPGWRPHPVPPPKQNKVGKWIGLSVAAVAVLMWVGSCASVLKGLGDSSDNSSNSSDSSSGSGSASAKALPDPKPVTYKGINIPDGYYVQFADSPPKPLNDDDGFYSGDLSYYDRDLRSGNDRIVLLNNAQQGSLKTCREETRYAESVSLSQLSKGSQFCVHTGSGHIALVTFRGTASENDPSDYVSLDFTIWRNAEEPSSQG